MMKDVMQMEVRQTGPLVRSALSRITQRDSEDIPATFCCVCGKEIHCDTPDAKWRLRDAFDPKCRDCQHKALLKFNEDRAAREESARLTGLEAIPQAFRATSRDQLPQPEKLDAALRWNYGNRGLLLHGPTGCGKTRILWEIARREINLGRKVRGISPYELTKYPAMIAAGDGSAIEFSDSLIEVDLLILDDVFKAKPTERIEELLFAVVDERGAWERPCLVSLNDTGDTLKERLSTDRGPALIRRFRDYCDQIQFK